MVVRVRALLAIACLLFGLLPAQAALAGSSTRDSDGDGLRDTWETRWGVSDPARRDSNGDGLIDANEDPDGDGLSNLGEQRFGTDPSKADSDGNGVSDGQQDSNADGIPDGLEQDRRPLPANLKPSLRAAPNDTPVSYSNGCHTFQGSAKIHPCVFGDPNGAVTVAIFGDSHALQWVPGLTRAAKLKHWRLVSITKSGCPSVDVRFRSRAFPNDAVPCQQWRQRAVRWLAAKVPDLIIIANSRGYTTVDAQGHPIPRDPAWGAGLDRTLSALPSSAHLLVLGDTPHLTIDPPRCLASHPHDISACETTRGNSLNHKHDAVESTTAAKDGARFVSLNPLVCSYDPCPVLAGNIVMWRNTSHLTATWVTELWPSLAALVTAALAP